MHKIWNLRFAGAIRHVLILVSASAAAAQVAPGVSPLCAPEPAAAVNAFLAREPGFPLKATSGSCAPGGPVFDYLTGSPAILRLDGSAAPGAAAFGGLTWHVPAPPATGARVRLTRARTVTGGHVVVRDTLPVASAGPVVVTTIEPPVPVPLPFGRPPLGEAVLLLCTPSQWEPGSRTLSDQPGLLVQVQWPAAERDLTDASRAEASFDAAFGGPAARRGISFHRVRYDLATGLPVAFFGTAVGRESGYAAGVFRVGGRWRAMYTWAGGRFNSYLLAWASEPATAW